MLSQSQAYSKTLNQNASIYVSSPLLDSAKGCFTYLVSGSNSQGPFEIRRRYNDFYYLRESLRKKWPGLYLPPVPEKMITGNKNEGNIEMRKRYFQYFLQGLFSNPSIFNCQITLEFLKNKAIDMEKFFTTFPSPKPSQKIKEYKVCFAQVQNIQQEKHLPTAEQKKVLTDFQAYLKKADKELKQMRTKIQAIIDSRNAFMINLTTVASSTLPDYEKNVYSEYLPSNEEKEEMRFTSRQQVQQNVHKLKQVTQKNSFQGCLDMISYEILEVQAMQQLLTDHENFEQHYHKCNEKLLSAESELIKLMGGKTTLKSFFSKGNKEEQIKSLQKQIPLMREEVQHWRRFINLITILIAQRQIPHFKKYKQLKYYSFMHQTSQNELNYLAVYGDLMKSLMQGIVKIK